MRVTVPPRRLVTHTAPAPIARAPGAPPTRTVSVTALEAGSTRFTRSSSGTVTQTPPAPTAMPLAPSPTGTVAAIWFVRGSIRVTVPSVLSETHTLPAPTAIAAGLVADRDRRDGARRVRIQARDLAAGAGDPDRVCRHRHRPRLLRVSFRRIQPD